MPRPWEGRLGRVIVGLVVQACCGLHLYSMLYASSGLSRRGSVSAAKNVSLVGMFAGFVAAARPGISAIPFAVMTSLILRMAGVRALRVGAVS